METVDWIKAGIAGLAVLAVYLVSIVGKPRGGPPPRGFAAKVLIAVMVVHVLASAILPTRPDLSAQMSLVEGNLDRVDLARDGVNAMLGEARRSGADTSLPDATLVLKTLKSQEAALKRLGRELAARSSRVLAAHRDMFRE
ncbi:MAG: hypothetical protein KF889_13075 [Alphaproteobacteria bacterium]|nr:hypothetical protein [Alphaproteobacteria bacterium]MCW5739072.1 hypothetical protein [Alphaproteobacteria bacterium]